MKTDTLTRCGSIFVVFMIAAASAVFVSCKEAAEPRAITTIVVGDVTLLREGARPGKLRHGEILKKSDTIVTAMKSFCAFQIGQEAVMKVSERSRIKLESILEGGNNRVFLAQGRVFTAVKKIGKGRSYEIQTKTTVAAVRGTEFSVNYREGAAVVAVNEGAVKVQRVDEKMAVAEEQMVEQGQAAVVTEDKSSTRSLNKEEIEEYDQDKKLIIVEDVQDKNEKELKKIEEAVLQGKLEVKDEEQEKAGGIADKSADENKLGSGKNGEKTAAVDKNADTLVWTSKRSYKPADPIIIGYKNMPESKYAWIAVAKAGNPGNQYEHYDWTNSNKNGQMVFEGLNLEPGNYEVHAHFNRSNDISKRSFFKVEE